MNEGSEGQSPVVVMETEKVSTDVQPVESEKETPKSVFENIQEMSPEEFEKTLEKLTTSMRANKKVSQLFKAQLASKLYAEFASGQALEEPKPFTIELDSAKARESAKAVGSIEEIARRQQEALAEKRKQAVNPPPTPQPQQ